MKLIGVWKSNYRLYHDLKHDDYFILTPNYHITRCPRRICDELADWCVKKINETKGIKYHER